MLSQTQVESIFREWIPADVTIVFAGRAEFIRSALDNPFIKMQIEIGIYDESNIYTDFLSPACAYTMTKRLVLCYDLMVDHAVDVPDDLTVAYLTTMAIHEAHHFEEDCRPGSAEQHAASESACIAATQTKDPALAARTEEFEALSAVYQRVYERITEIQNRRKYG